jgi:hypothetical protein
MWLRIVYRILDGNREIGDGEVTLKVNSNPPHTKQYARVLSRAVTEYGISHGGFRSGVRADVTDWAPVS